MKWVIITLVLVGVVTLSDGITLVQQYFSNDGLRHASLITSVFPFAVSITSLLGAYGCAKRKAYGWALVILLLSALLIGSTIWAIIAFRITVLSHYGALIWAAFLIWLLYLWIPQRKMFGMLRDSAGSPVLPSEQVVAKRNLAATAVWIFFGLCCLPVLYHAFYRLLMHYALFSHASPGGP
jgi:hypothetical protein